MDARTENLPILKDLPKKEKKEYHEIIIDTSKLGH